MVLTYFLCMPIILHDSKGPEFILPNKNMVVYLNFSTYPLVNKHNYGIWKITKSPCLMETLTISMAILNSYLSHYPRVDDQNIYFSAILAPSLTMTCKGDSRDAEFVGSTNGLNEHNVNMAG